MGPALRVGSAFAPLDEEWGLLSGGLTPRGEETLVRLSTWMPDESAREVTSGRARDAGEQSHRAPRDAGERVGSTCGIGGTGGAAEAGSSPGASGSRGAEKQALSGDGAMGHLVGGEWSEVKTLAIG